MIKSSRQDTTETRREVDAPRTPEAPPRTRGFFDRARERVRSAARRIGARVGRAGLDRREGDWRWRDDLPVGRGEVRRPEGRAWEDRDEGWVGREQAAHDRGREDDRELRRYEERGGEDRRRAPGRWTR